MQRRLTRAEYVAQGMLMGLSYGKLSNTYLHLDESGNLEFGKPVYDADTFDELDTSGGNSVSKMANRMAERRGDTFADGEIVDNGRG